MLRCNAEIVNSNCFSLLFFIVVVALCNLCETIPSKPFDLICYSLNYFVLFVTDFAVVVLNQGVVAF